MFKSKRASQIRAATITAFIWMAIGTITFHELEPWTWIQAVYFSVVTLTTVGYGDLHPTTDVARLIDVFYILIGVSAVVGAFSVLGTQRVNSRATKIEGRRQKSKQK
ncbi:MAG TPA: potassium channel family protein [Candidatus Binatia bacterium]|nr:potassium channel family protein [Candidatus Binatia bacterium]